jgi:hypothetical protein
VLEFRPSWDRERVLCSPIDPSLCPARRLHDRLAFSFVDVIDEGTGFLRCSGCVAGLDPFRLCTKGAREVPAIALVVVDAMSSGQGF